MDTDSPQARLRHLPSMTDLLASAPAQDWLQTHSRRLVTDCLRQALGQVRAALLAAPEAGSAAAEVSPAALLARTLADAEAHLRQRQTPRFHPAINATGIILHTGLGRAVFPAGARDALREALEGYVTLAVDRETGERHERDLLLEDLFAELTGAEAATVANNNAGATLLVLAALAADREVIVSRGQLIEIGGSFRLPDVLAQSRARLVEVGTTNRTHLRDYERALTPNTAAILRVHPSNYRVVGFTSEVPLPSLAALAQAHHVTLIDDLGAGALVNLEAFGLPHEPTVRESLEAGADVVLFSADKLIGASQAGVILGRRSCIDRIRHHPLMRALRVDKTCLVVLEQTLRLFRDPERLPATHPTYRMLATPPDVLRARAAALADALAPLAPRLTTVLRPSEAFLGSGSLPVQALPSFVVGLVTSALPAAELARRLRTDPACVFGRILEDQVCLDVRTLTDAEVPRLAAALTRILA